MTLDSDKSQDVQIPKEPALDRFISELTSEEKLLIIDYLEAPNLKTLSKNFDAIVEDKPNENKIN